MNNVKTRVNEDTIIIPVGTAIWPVKGVGNMSMKTFLPERVWCEKRKRLTRAVTVDINVTIPKNKKFSRFNDGEFRIAWFKLTQDPDVKERVCGFIYPVSKARVIKKEQLAIAE